MYACVSGCICVCVHVCVCLVSVCMCIVVYMFVYTRVYICEYIYVCYSDSIGVVSTEDPGSCSLWTRYADDLKNPHTRRFGVPDQLVQRRPDGDSDSKLYHFM